MQTRTNGLLPDLRPIAPNRDRAAFFGMLAKQISVELLDRAAEKLERHDEQDDADAGASEHAG